MKNEVNLSTLQLTYPLPALTRRSYISLTVNHLSTDYIKDTKISHVEAAGGVVFSTENKILMIFRRGVWDLPKGHREPGETLRECAAREVCEECGLLPDHLQTHEIVAETTHLSAPGEEKHTTWFRMLYTGAPADAKPQTEEDIARLGWFTPQQALENAQKSYPTIRQVLANVLR